MIHLALHVGAHGTDGGRIARWLTANRLPLEAQGLAMPAPGLFLRSLSEALDRDRNTDPLARETALLRALGVTAARRRLVVSAPGLLGGTGDVLSSEGFYRRDVARRAYGLGQLFPRCHVTLLFATGRATRVIPAILPPEEGAEQVMAALDDESLPWSRLAHTLRAQLPQARLVVWQHEDFAQVWPEVFEALLGPGVVLPARGLADLAADGIGAEAALRLKRYLEAKPATSARQLRDVVAAFGRRFGHAQPASADALPGWLGARLASLDRNAATEWADLAAIPGVTCLPLSQDSPVQTG